MAGVVHGNDVLFLVNNGTSYVPFVCAKDLTLDVASSLISVVTVGDGHWEKFAHQSIGYTITLTGVAKFDNASVTVFDLMQNQLQFVDVDYKMIFRDQESLNYRTIKGMALVERSSITGNYGQFSQTSFSLKGNGAYIVITCDAAIGGLTITQSEDDETLVTFDDIEGDPASYIYTIDNGFEITTTETELNLGELTPGPHTILVIPVCASGDRGDEISKYFISYITIEEDPDKPNVTDINFLDVSDTSFTISWTPTDDATAYTIRISNSTTGYAFNNTGGNPPRTISGLNPGTNYQITIYAEYPGGRSTGITVFSATTGTGDLPQQDNYDTELNFETSIYDTEAGVTGITGWTNALYKFEFDAIPGYTGVVHAMALTFGGETLITINFPHSYMGQPFRYRDRSGETFYGNFIAGAINYV